jgi:hypothetical protein
MRERERDRQTAEISFERAEGDADPAAMTVTGISEELLTSEDRIRQLMEVLDLPEGTTARVTVRASTVIVR